MEIGRKKIKNVVDNLRDAVYIMDKDISTPNKRVLIT